ncbi:unnamed protein product [Rotaria sp. Silwood2]|nr:unnamed protein product [Rotaria sp. Silwood2]
MTRPSTKNIGKTVRLAHNLSGSQKIVKSVTKKTRELQNDLISDANRSTSNEHFTYKKRPFVGPSCGKLSNFLEQQNPDVDEDANDYCQIIHNSFVLELMKQYLYFMQVNMEW